MQKPWQLPVFWGAFFQVAVCTRQFPPVFTLIRNSCGGTGKSHYSRRWGPHGRRQFPNEPPRGLCRVVARRIPPGLAAAARATRWHPAPRRAPCCWWWPGRPAGGGGAPSPRCRPAWYCACCLLHDVELVELVRLEVAVLLDVHDGDEDNLSKTACPRRTRRSELVGRRWGGGAARATAPLTCNC